MCSRLNKGFLTFGSIVLILSRVLQHQRNSQVYKWNGSKPKRNRAVGK